MVTFNISYTVPVNAPGVEPVLTQSQVWECMKRKVRHAPEFVPGVTGTEILSEGTAPSGGGVVQLQRRVTFAPGFHPAGAMEAVETCRLYEPCRTDFVAADGAVITSVVSLGQTGKPEDLNYTYIFEWRHEGIEAGSAEAKAQLDIDWNVCC